MRILSGTRLGPYEIEMQIGAGGMGEVYRAVDLRLGRAVAVKTPAAGLTDDAEAVARFDRENRTIAALSHPNILAVYDVGHHENVPYAVLELLEGETLRVMLDQGPLALATAVSYAQQLARGLAAAHDKNIVHRDLKPDNIFVTSSGVLKILDFGLARATTADDGETRLGATSPGVVLGTAAYMSPEQARGHTVDATSDVFSFGAVLYEMLAQVRAFHGSTVADAMAAVIRDNPAPLRSIVPAVPAGLDRIVTRCLEKTTTARFANGGAVLDALEALSTPSSPAKQSTAARPGIAVLPFDDLSPDHDNGYFVDGLADEVISDLSKVSALRVISRTSVQRFRGRARDLATIHRDLNVDYVLEGSVRKAGSKLRITAQLVNIGADASIWSDKYNGTTDDVFEIQEQVARAIVSALRVTLTPAESRELADHGIKDPRAYELYLRARAELQRYDAEGLGRALIDIDQALELEGESPLLLAARGDALWQQYNLGLQTDPAQLQRVQAIAHRLQMLDPSSVDASRLLAGIDIFEGRWEAAWRRLASVVANRQSDTVTAVIYVAISAFVGKADFARVVADGMIDVDPLQAINHYIAGFIRYFCDVPASGLPYMARGFELGPALPSGINVYAQALVAFGREQEARDAVASMLATAPSDNLTWLTEMFLWALDGRRDDIVATLTEERVRWARADLQYSLQLAEYFAILRDNDRAFDWLENAIRCGVVNYPFLSTGDPYLANLRGDLRFEPLMADVKTIWRRL
ncbi:MAG: protein kinase [Acidobacteriota bacterium]|nr:protein kinase [Acidobacteriota bacterium]